MLHKILFVVMALFAITRIDSTYACDTDGCTDIVYGPVGLVALTDDPELGTNIMAWIKQGDNSRATDDRCLAPASPLGPVYTFAAPYNRHSNSIQDAKLQILTSAQNSTQVMVIVYMWSAKTSTCVIQSVGYANP